jgi:small-conductance mechanosensitive channel
MTTEQIAIGDQVKVRMARDLEGKVHRIGERSATILVENEHGPIIISAPLDTISKISELTNI